MQFPCTHIYVGRLVYGRLQGRNNAYRHSQILIMEQWKCIVFVWEKQRDNVFARKHFTNYVMQRNKNAGTRSNVFCASSLLFY